MNILVGVPTRGSIDYRVAKSIGDLQSKGFDVIYARTSYGIEASRKKIARYAIDFDYDYLLFIDDDIVVENSIVGELLRCGVDIASASYPILQNNMIMSHCGKLSDGQYKHYIREAYSKKDGIAEVDAIGLGACLIRRAVLEDIDINEAFKIVYDGNGEAVKGEDYSFCEEAKRKGYNIFIDYNVIVKHLKTLPLGEVIAC